MGYKIEFNWVLKLSLRQLPNDNQKLEEGHIYEFEKDEERIYPLNIPIELVNDNWEILAEVKVLELTIGYGKTKGKCMVLAVPVIAKQKSMYSKYSVHDK